MNNQNEKITTKLNEERKAKAKKALTYIMANPCASGNRKAISLLMPPQLEPAIDQNQNEKSNDTNASTTNYENNSTSTPEDDVITEKNQGKTFEKNKEPENESILKRYPILKKTLEESSGSPLETSSSLCNLTSETLQDSNHEQWVSGNEIEQLVCQCHSPKRLEQMAKVLSNEYLNAAKKYDQKLMPLRKQLLTLQSKNALLKRGNAALARTIEELKRNAEQCNHPQFEMWKVQAEKEHREMLEQVKRTRWCYCGEKAQFWCCSDNFYCTRACQRKSWDGGHKRQCRRVKNKPKNDIFISKSS